MKESDLIFGLMASLDKKTYTIEQLKYLLKPFGISESCLRTTLSRMRQKNTVAGKKEGKKAVYGLFNKGKKIADNVAHSFRSLDWLGWDGSYWGVVFSVPETLKAERHSIRKNLIAYRFAMYSKGFWLRPYHREEAFLMDILAGKHCHVFKFYNLKDFRPELVNNLWKTEEINRAFGKALQVLGAKNEELAHYSPEQALVQKIFVGGEMVDAIVQDPLLPGVYLPDGWKADELRKSFFAWDKKVTEIAKPYWVKIF